MISQYYSIGQSVNDLNGIAAYMLDWLQLLQLMNIFERVQCR